MADKDKLKALELAVGQIEKQFGKGSIMRLDKDTRGQWRVAEFSSLCTGIRAAAGGGA